MESLTLGPGSLVADRFEIERMARAGGMGMVFRAFDRHTKMPIALKVLRWSEVKPQDEERFLREARVLSELHHPGIAAYVAHGRTPRGEIFLAMEWLEGEDLAERLARQPLSAAESLSLAREVADALALVHRRGVVHRDIKPSNVFLRERSVERAVLLDFGVARGGLGSFSVTRTGEVVGTLHYIAPEQARGERQVGPEADVYALGCVLYECLTGTPPFAGGDHVAMVLARILREDPQPLRTLRPDLPESLEALLGRMLAKERALRLRDGEAVLAALSTLETTPGLLDAAPAMGTRARVEGEQRLVSVVLATPGLSGARSEAGLEDVAAAGPAAEGPHDAAQLCAEQEALQELLGVYGAKVDCLANGATMATLSEAGHTAMDLATAAARCALALRERLPGATVVVATGRGLSTQGQTMGEAITRAGRLLEASTVGVRAGRVQGGPRGPGGQRDQGDELEAPPVWLDELTAGLLDTRFHAQRAETGVFLLQGARTSLDETRLVLGRPTPCVGREQELRLLEMLLEGCCEEPGAQAVLVTGSPGVGKSRLRHEFLRQLAERHEDIEVLWGRGDPLQTGAAYGLLGQALRRLADGEGDLDQEARRARLAERVGRYVAVASRRRVAEFLGELCGLPFPDAESAALRAARQDPRTMSDGVTAAVMEFLRAECGARPIILVLEDLHWGDLATVHVVDVALRELSDRPLLVLALARPEVKELFPRLWEGRKLQELRLLELGRKGSERLVEAVLGERARPEVKARIVAQAGGNALYLEELIRAVAEGAGEALPETMLAMLQARFLRLEPGARRLLRAASVLGETFWRGGVLALLGSEGRAEHDVGRWLEILSEAETIVRHPQARFAGEEEFAFRHALLRDAAYSLMTDEDRVAGHRFAAEYLERVGESDPMVLAEHYQRGGEPGRAASYFARAALRALEASDRAGAIERVERGVGCGATGELLGQLRNIEGWAYLWDQDVERAFTASVEALELLPPRSTAWYNTMSVVLPTAGFLERRDVLMKALRGLAEGEPLAEARSAFMEPGLSAVSMTGATGAREVADSYLRKMQEVGAQLEESDARARGFWHLATFWFERFFNNDPWAMWQAARSAREALVAAGDRRVLGLALAQVGVAHAALGDYEAAVGCFREALAQAIGAPLFLKLIWGDFAAVLLEAGGPEALAEAEQHARAAVRGGPVRWGGLARAPLALVLAARGELTAALAEARQANEILKVTPALRPNAWIAESQILRAAGRVAEAQAVAAEALGALPLLGGACWLDVKLHLEAAEVNAALGDEATARRLLEEAGRRIAMRAERIEDAAVRERYLGRVPYNACVLARLSRPASA